MRNNLDSRPEPSEIIEQYHKKKTLPPRICKKCGVGELKRTGRRTSASVNYTVWKCGRCGNEDLEFVGLDEDAKKVLGK